MITPILPTYGRRDLAFERGEGPYVYTADDRAFLDFGAGIAVNVLGHAHPHLVRALTEQATKLWHTSNLYNIPGQEKLAKRLVDATFADTVFFTNSGAEAMECTIKMARKYHSATGTPERYRIITFEGAFHGRTLATIAAGGQEKHLDGFGPPVDGFDQVPFFDLKAARAAITDQTAGILVEPVQGEGGINAIPDGGLKELRALCSEHGILLLLDEVQCGVGRTGKFLAHEWANVQPDIVAIAKAIGGGFPLGACLATEKAAVGMTTGSHGSTYGGNPLAMACGNAVLDIVFEDGFMDRVLEIGKNLRQKLARIVDENADIFDSLKGDGLMLGLKCRVPNTDVVGATTKAGLLTVGAGDNVVRLLPPLIITNQHVEEAISKIETACQTVRQKAEGGAQ